MTQVEQDAYDEIKRIVARDNLLTYAHYNENFNIHADASAFQLGAVKSQKGKPIASTVENLLVAKNGTQ